MKFSITFLCLCLSGAGTTLAIDKPAPEKAAADETGRLAAAGVAAAIKALGTSPAPKKISSIVFKAVRSSPGSVLPIVDKAVRVSPQDAAPQIVTAATAAVADPWKQVIYRRLATPDPGANPRNGIPMTLAEAIVRTAFDALPGLSFSSLQAAADAALRTDPATLLRNIQSPQNASGVGDAGPSNYANEPLRTPEQPAVSR